MSFDSYGWPSPWASSNKKNPFDTQETGIIQDTSSFDTQENIVVHNTSMFNTKWNNFWQVQDTSFFDTEKINNPKKHFVYFNPEWLISTRKHKKRVNKIVKKHLIQKYTVSVKKEKEILDLVADIESNILEEKKVVLKKVKTEKIEKTEKTEKKVEVKKVVLTKVEVKKNVKEKIDFELVDPQIWDADKTPKIAEQKEVKTKSFDDLMQEIKKDLQQKKEILNKDKEHNLHIKTLEQQWKTKKQILNLISINDSPKFIKYENNYEAFWINRKLANKAIALVKNKDNLWALHCTDWINKIYQKVAGERVYDSRTLFNWVMHISKWTGIWVKKYAPKSVISSIKPWEHIMVDLPVDGKYNSWKTHSLIALSKPNNWLIEVASYPSDWSEPIIEMYDLYGLDRAKSGKPIRIQTV